jgi:hypothetical protein
VKWLNDIPSSAITCHGHDQHLMTSETLDVQLSDAVFFAVRDGTYPEDESVVSAELQSSALDRLQSLLDNAREEVKVETRAVIHEAA